MGIARLVHGALLGLVLGAGPVLAQDEPTRLDPRESWVDDRWRGIEVSLALSRAAPWRVFTLDSPRRLVVELRGVDWQGAGAGLLLGDNATGVTVAEGAAGWSRLEVGLGRALAVAVAGMAVQEDGTARLRLVMEVTDEASFSASASASAAVAPVEDAEEPAPAPPLDDGFVVAIDPGHGGIDPGAEREGLREAHLMLALAEELAGAMEEAGMIPVLTREEDSFVSLQERMTLARAAGADVLLSLHADALEEDDASGASVYTLTDAAVDEASEKMVERHEGSDLLAGLDLSGEEDAVAAALMDLARSGTVPSSRRLAEALARELGRSGAKVNSRALRQAPLAVLNAADFPSVLVETGFLSDPEDRARLATPEGRAPIVRGVVVGLRAWAEGEAGSRP